MWCGVIMMCGDVMWVLEDEIIKDIHVQALPAFDLILLLCVNVRNGCVCDHNDLVL